MIKIRLIRVSFSKLSILIFVLLTGIALNAQNPVVNFNYERSTFNEGAPLPSETYFVLTGAASTQVNMVEFLIYSSSNIATKDPLFANTWKREYNNAKQSYNMPVRYKLRGDNNYTLVINYYRTAEDDELKNTMDELFNTLDAFVDLNFVKGKKSFSLNKSSSAIVKDMNSLVESALAYYKSPSNIAFEGFSDLVKEQIETVAKTKYNKVFGKKTDLETRKENADYQLKELKVRLHSEVAHLFNSGLSILGDSKIITNYPSQEQKNTITLSLGYGGTAVAGGFDNAEYDRGVMAGVAIPFGNRAFAPAFFSKTAFMTGIFLNDFSSAAQSKITGPLVNKPIYAGLGYNVFEFLRVTAGTVLLTNDSGGNKDIYFKPYVGLTIDINVWIGIGKR